MLNYQRVNAGNVPPGIRILKFPRHLPGITIKLWIPTPRSRVFKGSSTELWLEIAVTYEH